MQMLTSRFLDNIQSIVLSWALVAYCREDFWIGNNKILF